MYVKLGSHPYGPKSMFSFYLGRNKQFQMYFRVLSSCWKHTASTQSCISYWKCTGMTGGTHMALPWRYNGRDCDSNHQPYDCLLNRLLRRRSKKTSKLRVTGLCEGNSPVTGQFPAQMANNAESVSIWWRHHEWHKYKGWGWNCKPIFMGNIK